MAGTHTYDVTFSLESCRGRTYKTMVLKLSEHKNHHNVYGHATLNMPDPEFYVAYFYSHLSLLKYFSLWTVNFKTFYTLPFRDRIEVHL